MYSLQPKEKIIPNIIKTSAKTNTAPILLLYENRTQHWHRAWIRTLHNNKKRYDKVIFFYVFGSVHRWSVLIIVQRDTTQSSLFIILQGHSTCFGCQSHPSSGVHKTVTTASGTGHIFCAATSHQRGQASLATLVEGSCSSYTSICSYSLVYWW